MLSDELRKDVDKLIEIESPRTFSSIDWHPYGGKVPQALIEIWQKVGSAAWHDNSYQSINPGLYKNVQEIAFESSLLDGAAAVPYIMSAFGRLTTWHAQYGLINIDPIFGKNIIPKSPQKRALGASSGDIEILSGFPILDPDEEDFQSFSGCCSKAWSIGRKRDFRVCSEPLIWGQSPYRLRAKVCCKRPSGPSRTVDRFRNILYRRYIKQRAPRQAGVIACPH